MSPTIVCNIMQHHQETGACLKQLTSCGSLPLSNREIFFSFMSDQKMVPVCILEAVATTFSTMIGTLSSPCSLRSATKMEWRFEMMRKAALWSKMARNAPSTSPQVLRRKEVIFYLFIYLFTTMCWNRIVNKVPVLPAGHSGEWLEKETRNLSLHRSVHLFISI